VVALSQRGYIKTAFLSSVFLPGLLSLPILGLGPNSSADLSVSLSAPSQVFLSTVSDSRENIGSRSATRVEPFHIQLESLPSWRQKPIRSKTMAEKPKVSRNEPGLEASVDTESPKKPKQGESKIKAGRVVFVAVERGLHIRKSPWGPILTTLEFNDPVTLLSTQDQWSLVQVGNQRGYAFKTYLGERKHPSTLVSSPVLATGPKVGGIQVPGVRIISQNTKDPFDESGSRGKYPAGYCGPASLQMVLDYYGVHKSRDFLALTDIGHGRIYKKGRGSAYNPMVSMSRFLGFDETEVVWSKTLKPLSERLRLGRPQIVSLRGHLKFKWGSRNRRTKGHIVVVTGVTRAGDIVLHDPAGMGERKIMSAQNFQQVWRGFMVDVKQGNNQTDLTTTATLSQRASQHGVQRSGNIL
jgi:hypothetical protein